MKLVKFELKVDFERMMRDSVLFAVCWWLFAASTMGCRDASAPPNPDASDAAIPADAGDVCSLACANLAALGCVEGGPRCLDVCQHDQAQPVTVLPLACWANAPTKDAARACGTATTGHLACP